jgi:hypothetical protein
VVGPADGAGHVRDREADEGDGPGGGDRGAAQDDDRQRGDGAGDLHALAQRAGDVLPEGEGVERAGRREGEHDPDGDEGQHPHGDLAVPPGQGPDHPEAELVEGGDVEQEDGGGARGQQGGEGGTGQRQLHRGGAPPAQGPERVDDDAGHGRPGEGAPHVARQRPEPEGADANHDGEGGTGLDAEEARVGQRVPGDALHDRTGEAEGDAGAEADDGAGDAEGAHDEVVVDG